MVLGTGIPKYWDTQDLVRAGTWCCLDLVLQDLVHAWCYAF